MRVTNAPQNTTVTEGNNTTFTCTAEENGSPVTVGWRFIPKGEKSWRFIPKGGNTSSQIPLENGTNLTGIEMVTVSDGLRTVLTFSGVRREADGGKVKCLAAGDISEPALLTVQCEFDHIPLFSTYHHFTFSGAVMLAQVERVCFSFA